MRFPFPPHPSLRSCLFALACTLSSAGAVAAQQSGQTPPSAHVAEFGAYTLRANVIASEVLPPATARRHGIERGPERGVLNLVVLERQPDGSQRTVTADVDARKDDLLGQTVSVPMREIRENDRVSYLGTFSFAPLRNFRFTIDVRPADTVETMTLTFEDHVVTER